MLKHFDQVCNKRSLRATEGGQKLKDFGFRVVDVLYYLRSKNKGADQLRVQRAGDLRFSFCIYMKQVLSRGATFMLKAITITERQSNRQRNDTDAAIRSGTASSCQW